MDTKVVGPISCKSSNKMAKDSADMETDEGLCLSSSPSVDDDGFVLTPVTPESKKESSELMSCFASPLTIVSSPPTKGFSMTETDANSPSTPKASVFDPFAPGPNDVLLAPRTKKCLQESRSYVERRLNFNSIMTKNDQEHVPETAFDNDDDNMLIEAIYNSLLECIVSKQAEDILGEIPTADSTSSPDTLMTPPFAPRLTGIAKTCPNAPLKAVKKSRYIDLGLCRKLEF